MILPFFMVIVVQMKRMRNQSHVFAYCYLTAVVSGATIFALSNVFFLVAAFRADRSPELIMLLNDLAWIVLIAPVGMVVSQFVLLALAVYFDDRTDPVFPGGWAISRCSPPRQWFRGRRGRIPHRAAGLGRPAVVLAAQWCVRRVRRGDVLRPAYRTALAGRRGSRGRRVSRVDDAAGAAGGGGARQSGRRILRRAPDGVRPDVWLMTLFFPAWYAVFGVIICLLTGSHRPLGRTSRLRTRWRSSLSTTSPSRSDSPCC
jgi:hypothetical protein